AVHGHSDSVASLDVFTHGTGDGHVGFGLSLVDHVVTGNGVDRDGGFGQIGINVVWTLCVSGSGVACFVFSCNLGFNFSVTKQVYAWNIQVASFAVGIHGRGDLFAANSDGDGVTCFNVFTNRTGDGHVGFRFSLVDDVIFSNHVNSDVGLGRRYVYVVRLLVGSGRGVASVVSRGDLGFNLVVVDQFGTRNVHVPGLAVRINGGFVFFTTNGHGDLVARFDVFTDCTGDRDIAFRLFLIDHVIARNRIDIDLSFWRHY